MTTNPTNVYGIVLIPDAVTCALLQGLSLMANAAWSSKIVLDVHRGPFPHLSLFHVLMRDADVQGLYRALIPDRHEYRPVSGQCHELVMRPGGWLFVQATDRQLMDMQERVVQAAAPLRAGNVKITWKMSEAQQTAHREYGYPNVGEAWDSHFTVGLIDEARVRGSVVRQLRPGLALGHTWSSNQLAIVRLGRHGVASQVVHTISLEERA